MQSIHTPRVNARYWTAITLASVFGTNMGDFYAHNAGLGILKGLLVLAVLTAGVFLAERVTSRRTELFYWLVIIIIRTGATNIADWLAYRVKIPPLPLTLGLMALIALFGWGTHRKNRDEHALPQTNVAYWLAMLGAGVFGTVLGDICEHHIGDGPAAVLLAAVLLAVLVAGRGRAARITALYWTTVSVARTAGTAIGDWLAENKVVHVGLPLSTLMSGIAFVAVLVAWRSPRDEDL